MVMVRRDHGQRVYRQSLHRAFIKLIAHANVELPGEHGHIFRRGMPVRHDSIAIRRLNADSERADLAGITGEDRELSAGREDRRRGAPLNLVWCHDDRSRACWFGFGSGFLWCSRLRQSKDWE